MLLWVADVIIAADDALFSRPGRGHGCQRRRVLRPSLELGARKAKELLFTGDWVTAAEAHQLGMVNHVVPAAELRPFTMEMARRDRAAAELRPKLAKEASTSALEAQGPAGGPEGRLSRCSTSRTPTTGSASMPVDPGPSAP